MMRRQQLKRRPRRPTQRPYLSTRPKPFFNRIQRQDSQVDLPHHQSNFLTSTSTSYFLLATPRSPPHHPVPSFNLHRFLSLPEIATLPAFSQHRQVPPKGLSHHHRYLKPENLSLQRYLPISPHHPKPLVNLVPNALPHLASLSHHYRPLASA